MHQSIEMKNKTDTTAEKILIDSWQSILKSGAMSLSLERKVPDSPLMTLRLFSFANQHIHDEVCLKFNSLLLSMYEAFPENIFWDLNALVFSTVKSSLSKADHFIESLEQRLTLIKELMQIFGKHSAIRFQYFHDFSLGFDWVKWRSKFPEIKTERHEPFSIEFLSYMKKRGLEIIDLIAKDDAKYPHIPQGEFRNSYSFGREPEVEKEGLIRLRDLGGIPLKIWNDEACISESRDFFSMRKQVFKYLEPRSS